MHDIGTIESELRLLAAVRWTAAEVGAPAPRIGARSTNYSTNGTTQSVRSTPLAATAADVRCTATGRNQFNEARACLARHFPVLCNNLSNTSSTAIGVQPVNAPLPAESRAVIPSDQAREHLERLGLSIELLHDALRAGEVGAGNVTKFHPAIAAEPPGGWIRSQDCAGDLAKTAGRWTTRRTARGSSAPIRRYR